MSSGCWRRQPREAQNSDSLKMSCCSVTIRDCQRAWSHLAQHPRGLQLLLEVQVDQAPMRRLELARRAAASSGSAVQRVRRRPSRRRCQEPQRRRPTARCRRRDGAQRRQTNTCSRGGITAPPLQRTPLHAGHSRDAGYTPCSRSSQYSKYRASGSIGAPAAIASTIDDAEPVQPLVGVRLRRPLVDQLGEVPDVPERRRAGRCADSGDCAAARRS